MKPVGFFWPTFGSWAQGYMGTSSTPHSPPTVCYSRASPSLGKSYSSLAGRPTVGFFQAAKLLCNCPVAPPRQPRILA